MNKSVLSVFAFVFLIVSLSCSGLSAPMPPTIPPMPTFEPTSDITSIPPPASTEPAAPLPVATTEPAAPLPAATTEPTAPLSATETPTPVPPGKTIIGLWERRSADYTERLNFKDDGSYTIENRKNSTNKIAASTGGTFTYDEGNIYYVDKNKKKTTETYSLSQDGNVLVMNNKTDKAWERVERAPNG